MYQFYFDLYQLISDIALAITRTFVDAARAQFFFYHPWDCNWLMEQWADARNKRESNRSRWL